MKVHITEAEYEVTNKLLEVLELFIGDDGFIRNSHGPLSIKGKTYVFPEEYIHTSFEFDQTKTELFRPLAVAKIADHIMSYFLNFTVGQDESDVIDGYDFKGDQDIILYCIGDGEHCTSNSNKTSLYGCRSKNHAKVGVIIKHLDPSYDILSMLKEV